MHNTSWNPNYPVFTTGSRNIWLIEWMIDGIIKVETENKLKVCLGS